MSRPEPPEKEGSCHHQQLQLPGPRRRNLLLGPHDYGRDIGNFDRAIKEVGPRKLGKVQQFVPDLLDLPADLFPRFHPNLDGLPDVLFQNAQDGIARLEVDLALGEKIAAGESEKAGDEKRRAFHGGAVLPKNPPDCQRNNRSTPVEFNSLADEAPALESGMEPIGENLERVRAQIAEAAKKSGRSLDDIKLVAISKTHEAEKVRAAFDAGQQLFGESRVQEARAKIPLLPSAARWHFVGRLQKNKIRHALPLFELFHSVDSVELGRDMNRIAEEDGWHPRVLLEVNVAGEGSKIGFAPDVLRAQMEALLALPRLTIEGLMTIPPLAPEPEASRQYFVALRELRDALATEFQLKLPQLSMGMSGDFAVAIEEGATLVRVGTSIFGKRTPPRERARAAFDNGD